MWRIFNTIQHPSLIGVDVSDTSIKVLQLDEDQGISAYGRSMLPKGVVLDGVIMDVEAFSAALNKILAHTKPQSLRQEHTVLRAIIGLPESKIFTYQLTIPPDVLPGNIDRYIEDEVRKVIPLPLSDLYWDYHVLLHGPMRSATFMGVRKMHLDTYIEAFSRADAKPLFVSGALYALGHALIAPTTAKPQMVIDIGARTSTIGVFHGDLYACASVSVPIGGTGLTTSLMEHLSLTKGEAEELKHTRGVTANEDTRVATVLREALEELLQEIQCAKSFHENKLGALIGEVILSGGTALMPGLSEYMEERLGVSVRVGDPLLRIKNKEVLDRGMPGIFFANVIGLAHAARTADLNELNLLTQYRKEEGTAEKESITLREARTYREVLYVFQSKLEKAVSRLVPLMRWVRRVPVARMKAWGAVIFLLGALSFLLWVIGTYA